MIVDRAAYLPRIGSRGPTEPRAEVLAHLSRAQLLVAPCDHWDITSGRAVLFDEKVCLRKYRCWRVFRMMAPTGWVTRALGDTRWQRRSALTILPIKLIPMTAQPIVSVGAKASSGTSGERRATATDGSSIDLRSTRIAGTTLPRRVAFKRPRRNRPSACTAGVPS